MRIASTFPPYLRFNVTILRNGTAVFRRRNFEVTCLATLASEVEEATVWSSSCSSLLTVRALICIAPSGVRRGIVTGVCCKTVLDDCGCCGCCGSRRCVVAPPASRNFWPNCWYGCRSESSTDASLPRTFVEASTRFGRPSRPVRPAAGRLPNFAYTFSVDVCRTSFSITLFLELILAKLFAFALLLLFLLAISLVRLLLLLAAAYRSRGCATYRPLDCDSSVSSSSSTVPPAAAATSTAFDSVAPTVGRACRPRSPSKWRCAVRERTAAPAPPADAGCCTAAAIPAPEPPPAAAADAAPAAASSRYSCTHWLMQPAVARVVKLLVQFRSHSARS